MFLDESILDGFIYRTDTDIDISYKHRDGKQEQMPLRRLVQAYADFQGLRFKEWPGEHLESYRGEGLLRVEVTKERGDIRLSFDMVNIVLPDTDEVWGEKEANQLASAIHRFFPPGNYFKF